MRVWLRRLAYLFRQSREAADLREEMETHRALREAQLERGGLASAEAARASRRALGNVTLAREDARDLWIVRGIDTLRQDVRNGFRILVKHRGVTATAVISLALGIGANAAVFSLVDAVLFRPLPYREPNRLVMIFAVPRDRPDQQNSATVPEYLAWQEHTTLFDGLATAFQQTLTVGGEENGLPAEAVLVEKVRASLFSVLGVRPAIGRAFRTDEERVDAPAPVALLTDQFWSRRYARDPRILNRVIVLNGVPTTIVGVMPPSFVFLGQGKSEVLVPLSFNSPQLRGTARVFPVAARLKDGVTVAQAQGEMDAVVKQLEPTLPAPSKGWRARVVPLAEAVNGDFRTALALLQSIVSFILLIACGNVAGLLLARSSARRTEMALRAAIGAGRRRLVRQLLTESVMLALAGGAAGLAVGWLLSKLFAALLTRFVPVLPALSIDLHVLSFTLGVSVVTGLLFGVLPALEASRSDLVSALQSAARGAADVLVGQRIRVGVVVAQVALACVLLVAAGLTVRSLVRLETSDLGGAPEGVLRVTVPFQGMFRQAGSVKGYPLVDVSPRVSQTIDQLLGRLRALPGVQSVAGASLPPFTSAGPLIAFGIEGRPPVAGESHDALSAAYQVVTPGFFTTMRIPMLQGREFDDRDAPTGPWGIVINGEMARRFWPGANPIGHRVVLDMTSDEQPREVIGVVSNYRSNPYERESQPAMFVLHTQQPLHTRGPLGMVMRNRMSFVLRADRDPAALAGLVRAALADVARDQPIPEVRAADEDVAEVLAPSRSVTVVFGLFAGLATLLAAVGIYGVMSQGVNVRRREIGIRMALGAERRELMRMILRGVLLLAGIGLAIGLLGALALAELLSTTMSGVLSGIPPTDVLAYLAAAVLMVLVAMLAGWIPTRRAVRVTPTVALRCE